MSKKKEYLRTIIETGQLKWFVIGSVLVLGAVGTGIWYVRKSIKKRKKANIEEKTLEQGSLENIAKKIAIELDKSWYEWKDGDIIIEAIKSLKSKEEYNKVMDIYGKLTGKILNEELANYFSQSELKTIEDIISLKPEKIDKNNREVGKPDLSAKAEQFADEIRDAVEGLDMVGTSCKKVLNVFRKIPNLAFYEQMKKIYEQKYGDLWDDLLDEFNIRFGLVVEEGFQSCESVLKDIVKKLK